MKTKLTFDLADILKRKYPRGFHAPADLDIDLFLEFADDDWEHVVDVDVRDVLAERNAIALIWDADMLLSRYPHLTKNQAWEVLQECERNYKGEEGLTWDDIGMAVHESFPKPAEAKQRLLDRLNRLRRRVEALPFEEQADPAAYGAIAAEMDDVEATIRKEGA